MSLSGALLTILGSWGYGRLTPRLRRPTGPVYPFLPPRGWVERFRASLLSVPNLGRPRRFRYTNSLTERVQVLAPFPARETTRASQLGRDHGGARRTYRYPAHLQAVTLVSACVLVYVLPVYRLLVRRAHVTKGASHEVNTPHWTPASAGTDRAAALRRQCQ
jgi:hypothetical protein